MVATSMMLPPPHSKRLRDFRGHAVHPNWFSPPWPDNYREIVSKGRDTCQEGKGLPELPKGIARSWEQSLGPALCSVLHGVWTHIWNQTMLCGNLDSIRLAFVPLPTGQGGREPLCYGRDRQRHRLQAIIACACLGHRVPDSCQFSTFAILQVRAISLCLYLSRRDF